MSFCKVLDCIQFIYVHCQHSLNSSFQNVRFGKALQFGLPLWLIKKGTLCKLQSCIKVTHATHPSITLTSTHLLSSLINTYSTCNMWSSPWEKHQHWLFLNYLSLHLPVFWLCKVWLMYQKAVVVVVAWHCFSTEKTLRGEIRLDGGSAKCVTLSQHVREVVKYFSMMESLNVCSSMAMRKCYWLMVESSEKKYECRLTNYNLSLN